MESGSWYVEVCKLAAIECHMCFNAAQSVAPNLEYCFCRLVERAGSSQHKLKLEVPS